jgi:hypothetical protein
MAQMQYCNAVKDFATAGLTFNLDRTGHDHQFGTFNNS